MNTRIFLGTVLVAIILSFGTYLAITSVSYDMEGESDADSIASDAGGFGTEKPADAVRGSADTVTEAVLDDGDDDGEEEEEEESDDDSVLTATPPAKTTAPTTPVVSAPATQGPMTQTTVPKTEVTAPSSPYTMSAVAAHNSKFDCWSVINGNVYDLTKFIPVHPGGEQRILNLCGEDGTSAFNSQHGKSSKVATVLAGMLLAPLAK